MSWMLTVSRSLSGSLGKHPESADRLWGRIPKIVQLVGCGDVRYEEIRRAVDIEENDNKIINRVISNIRKVLAEPDRWMAENNTFSQRKKGSCIYESNKLKNGIDDYPNCELVCTLPTLACEIASILIEILSRLLSSSRKIKKEVNMNSSHRKTTNTG